jgi:hypothetical protein
MASPPQIDIPVVEENTVYTMKEKLEWVTSKSELDSLISEVKKVDKTKCCPFCDKKPDGYSYIKNRNQHLSSYCLMGIPISKIGTNTFPATALQ